MTSNTPLERAECSLSETLAYKYTEPYRKMWGFWKCPKDTMTHMGRATDVKNFIWC